MNDIKQPQHEATEFLVPEVTPEPASEDEAPSAELIAWIESLGEGGAERCVKAGQLMMQIGSLVVEAGKAIKTDAVGELEDFNRRAKVLAAHAEVSGFDWLNQMTRGTQILIASWLRFARGNQAVLVFRHRKAKQEYQAAMTGISEAIQLIDDALERFPHVPELVEARSGFQQAVYFNQQLLAYIAALEKNCDVEALLLEGRVRQYLDGVRALASEMRRLSDGMLGSGSDDSELLSLSARLSTMADTFEERAEAIEEIDRVRDVYLPPGGDKIFVIHGHAEDKWRELRDLLEDKLGLKGRVIVLKEEASRSETVLQKYEKYAKQCCFAFALMTPDDQVRTQDAAYRQARPNVLFEIGWFFGRLGPSRLCILKRSGSEVPSDLDGVVTLEFDKDVGEKFLKIEDELKAAGVIAP